MKTIRNILLVIIFVIIIGFCLYVAPNYKTNINNSKTNLVINYSNVTSKMKGEVILENGEVYISKDDIENYYDKYIYYEKSKNYIVVAANNKYAYFDIDKGTLNIDNKEFNKKVILKDNMYYIPISSLESVYNIKVNNITDNNTVIIESLDKSLVTAETKNLAVVKSKATKFSRTLVQLNQNEKVSIVPIKEEESKEIKYSNKFEEKFSKFVSDIESKVSKDWILVRTQSGFIGYVKKEALTEQKTERTERKNEKETISLVWDYFSEYGKAPDNKANKYDSVNVVSPSFFTLKNDTINDNVGNEGLKYIKWAKDNNYKVWGMLQSNNLTKEDMQNFSNWINDYSKRQEIIKQIVNLVDEYNLDGINLDFENIYKSDKEALSRFVIELKPRMAAKNAILSIDVTEPDGSANWSLCFDRKVLGDVCDYIIFMAYDQFGSYSKTPGSTATYNWVEKNIKKFINQEEVDANKIILGVPFYTRLWKIKDNEVVNNSTVSMKNEEKYSSTDKKWLEDEKQYYVEYEKNGYTYKMWVEDEKSIGYKLDLIKKYNLSGVAFWQKGFEDDSIWNMVKSKLF